MATTDATDDPKFYALIDYEDPYVQPLLLSALQKRLPPSTYHLIPSFSPLLSPTSPILQFLQYEAIDFPHHLDHPTTSLANAYIFRKALIRKHYLSTTVSNWITKYPDSVLKKHVVPSVEFEVDYAEFLDDALVEAWEVRESWARGEGKRREEREWWILKPGMSERGQGIRLFSCEEELVAIFEGWDEDEEEEEEEDEEDVRSDAGEGENSSAEKDEEEEEKEGNGIITSQLRHFIAQPYIHPPLLLPPPSATTSDALHKFHIRAYVLAVGALKVYVYKDMLSLFAARPYVPPWESQSDDEGLKAHLTNTCLQDSSSRDGSVGLFWELPDVLPQQSSSSTQPAPTLDWKTTIFTQICHTTGAVFEAAARGMSIHFQPLPNSFEIFGLDFMVGEGKDGEMTTYLLEVNAFPDFRQTGEELRGVVEGLFEGVVDVGVKPFFGIEGGQGNGLSGGGGEKMVQVLDIDLGRR
jgi:tubulin--tyrosine ligase